MNIVLKSLLLSITFLNACGQNNKSNKSYSKQNTSSKNSKDIAVGGPCDRCDVMFEGMPFVDKIMSEASIADKTEPGERMELNGSILRKDGKTPARNIILYLYHTNAKGYYTPSGTQTLGRMNGHLTAWVKTDENGKFIIYSVRPAPYPNRKVPAHIHILIKEPNKTRYYIDEVWFDDDLLITKKLKDEAEKRGGDLIIHLVKNNNNTWVGNLKITLGLNIPDYK